MAGSGWVSAPAGPGKASAADGVGDPGRVVAATRAEAGVSAAGGVGDGAAGIGVAGTSVLVAGTAVGSGVLVDACAADVGDGLTAGVWAGCCVGVDVGTTTTGATVAVAVAVDVGGVSAATLRLSSVTTPA